MPDIEEYVDRAGNSPFKKWFDKLDAQTASRVTVSITRVQYGSTSNVKPVGPGREVFEYTINHGPGYRIYFGKVGNRLVILLAGGTKKTQQRDIEAAHERWLDYKRQRG